MKKTQSLKLFEKMMEVHPRTHRIMEEKLTINFDRFEFVQPKSGLPLVSTPTLARPRISLVDDEVLDH